MKKSFQNGFTLVEVLVVVAILGVLASLVMPSVSKVIERAQSVTCMNNLRQIGIAFTSYAAENDGTFPYIEPNEENPVYPDDQGFDAQPILERLQPYGLTVQALKCPADTAANNSSGSAYFTTRGSSYQWCPVVDGEEQISAMVYGRRGARKARLARTRICMDFEAVHFNRCNRLYADGHAVAELK